MGKALVKKDKTVTVKVCLDSKLKSSFDAYSKYVGTTRNKVANVALERLFAQDLAWVEHKSQK